MILEGANKLKEDSLYTVYAMNSTTAGQYCVVMPNNINDTLNMLIDLHEKSLFDEVASETKTKDDLINALEKEYEQVKTKYPFGILIVPMIKEDEYANAVNTLDKQKMFDETKKIGAITSELYKKLTESGVEKQKINQKIIMIEKEEVDGKYVNWLKEQMPNYVEGISLGEKKEETPVPQETTNIFGIPTEEVKNEAPSEPIAPQLEEAPKTDGIFDNNPIPPATQEPIPTPPLETPTIPQAPTVPTENVDIFGIPKEQPAAPVSNIETPTPAVPEQAPPQESPTLITPEEPKAVQNVALEGTTTFSAIPNNPQQTVENANQPQPEEGKKSNGFVNLAILLVVLIGVTIVSIELGKFLYSVYGA